MSREVRRLRMFAGPNGSGKSTIVGELLRTLGPDVIGPLVVADDLEGALRASGVDLASFDLAPTAADLRTHFERSTWLQAHVPTFDAARDVAMNGTVVTVTEPTSYHAAVLADFVRQLLLDAGRSFSFETVMSSDDKVRFLEEAGRRGYRTYLYFVATRHPDINVARVALRVAQGGHDVREDLVRSRYDRSLRLLLSALKHATRAFLFDNSRDPRTDEASPSLDDLWIAELTEDDNLVLRTDDLPAWFDEHIWRHLDP